MRRGMWYRVTRQFRVIQGVLAFGLSAVIASAQVAPLIPPIEPVPMATATPAALMATPTPVPEGGALRRGAGISSELSSTREEIRRAFIRRDYERVVALTDQLRQQFPNVNHQSYYLSMSQIKLSEREAHQANRSFRRLSDAPGQVANDSPSLAAGVSASELAPVAATPGDSAVAPAAEATSVPAAPAASEAVPSPVEETVPAATAPVGEPAGEMIPVDATAPAATPAAEPAAAPEVSPAAEAGKALADEAAGLAATKPSGAAADERQIALAVTPAPVDSIPTVPSLPPPPGTEDGVGGFSMQPTTWLIIAITVVALISLAAFLLRRRQDAAPEGPEWEAEGEAASTGVADERRMEQLARPHAAGAGIAAPPADDFDAPAVGTGEEFEPEPFAAPQSAAVAEPEEFSPATIPVGFTDDDLFNPTASTPTAEAGGGAASDFFASMGETPTTIEEAPATGSEAPAAAEGLFDIFEIPSDDPFAPKDQAPAMQVGQAISFDEPDTIHEEETLKAPASELPSLSESLHIAGFDEPPAAPIAERPSVMAPPINLDALDTPTAAAAPKPHSEDVISFDSLGGFGAAPKVADEAPAPSGHDLPSWEAELPSTRIEEAPVSFGSSAVEAPATDPEEAPTQTIFPARRDEERIAPPQESPSEDTVTSWQEQAFDRTQTAGLDDWRGASQTGNESEVKAFHPDETVHLTLDRGDEPASGEDTINSFLSQSGFHARPDAEVVLPPQFDLPAMDSSPSIMSPNAPTEIPSAVGLPRFDKPAAEPPPPSPAIEDDDMGTDLFDREYRQGRIDADQGNWAGAVHHLSIAAALRPDVQEVKERLREARRMKNA